VVSKEELFKENMLESVKKSALEAINLISNF